MVVSVEATTAMLTSRVPAMAASRMPSPRSRALAMLSSTTIESSTTRPVASARPPSDITLRLRPSWPMKKNVAMIDTGSDRPITNVLQPSRRNRKMIRIASMPPITASFLTSLMAWRMNCDWSSIVVSSTSGGICFLDLFQALLDRVGGGDGIGVAFLVDRQLDRFLAGQADDRLAFLVALAHVGDVLQAHRHAAGDAALPPASWRSAPMPPRPSPRPNRSARRSRAICAAALAAAPSPPLCVVTSISRISSHAGELVHRAHQVTLRAFLQATAGDVDVLLLQALDDGVDRQVELRQLLLVDVDLDLVLEAAADLDRGHAFDRLELLLQVVVGVAAQLGELAHGFGVAASPPSWPTARGAGSVRSTD